MNLEQRCAESGLKMTGQRKIILKVLDEADDHPSVEAVYERAKALDATISMATVYRTLNLLDELQLVIRRDFNEKFSRYDINTDHHHHLIDVESGEVIEFQNQEIEDMKAAIARNLGYDLVECKLELYGRKIKKSS
ncbi:MAG: transcriptional repressor [Alphaproteobacteria bacterium]|nr:transcriptional repressor [Alphaproteobacteria bacterium]